MPKNSSLRPRRLPSLGREALQWVINVPASPSSTGKRQRRFFATRQQAEIECELLKTRKFNFGHSLRSLSPARIAEAVSCYERLEQGAPGVGLSHAVTEFLALHHRRNSSVTVSTLCDRFLQSKTAASATYQQELAGVFKKLRPTFGSEIASTIASARIEES